MPIITVDDPELLTVREVAVMLRVDPSTVWRKVNRGELPALRMGYGSGRGKMIRIARGDLVAYLRDLNGGQ